jgi:hypothetical protein
MRDLREVVGTSAIAAGLAICSTSIAEAGLRGRCAASTGVRSAALSTPACAPVLPAAKVGKMSPAPAAPENASKGSLCQQRAGFTQAQWEAGQTTKTQRSGWESCMQS